ncbi:MAG: hybrid sensor histidine kinase/response regulator [Gammaproteobacteria bacterium]|nr:hybrid sensor histidine kinase/response regulator [Gammaproteobacteria bacterium]
MQYCFYRVITNLVYNAIEYTHKGKIVIGCRRQSSCVKIIILDTGTGISNTDIKYIFDEYYSGNQENDHVMGVGLGLGLSIVEHTLNLLGHKLDLKSEQNKYSMFTIEVPYGYSQGNLTVIQNSIEDRELYDMAGHTAFIADDNIPSLDALHALLESWGFDLITADSYGSACDIINDNKIIPDIAIFDYLLDHEHTGIELADNLKSMYGNIPCIVLSGVVSRHLEVQITNHGYDLLYKPVCAAELYRKIKNRLALWDRY